jgi:hypothetical protein
MTPNRFRTLIEGALEIWRVEAAVSFAPGGSGCEITAGGGTAVAVSVEAQPFGTIWRLCEEGRRDRVHPAVGPALRSLREMLCPDRPAGRVLFISEGGG